MQYREYLDQWNHFIKFVAEPTSTANEFFGNITKRYAEQTLELVGDMFQNNITQLENFNQIRTPQDLFTIQINMLNELNNNSIRYSKKFLEICQRNMSDHNEFLKHQGVLKNKEKTKL